MRAMKRSLSQPSALRQLLMVLAGAALLLVPGMLNQEPFLYRDTTTYFKGAETGVVRLLGESFALGRPAEVPDVPVDGNTGASLTSVEDGVVIAGRSVYYGVLVYASLLLGSLFVLAALQAL